MDKKTQIYNSLPDSSYIASYKLDEKIGFFNLELIVGMPNKNSNIDKLEHLFLQYKLPIEKVQKGLFGKRVYKGNSESTGNFKIKVQKNILGFERIHLWTLKYNTNVNGVVNMINAVKSYLLTCDKH